MPNARPCRKVSLLRAIRNATRKKTKYPADRNTFGSLKVTASPSSKPISAVRRMRCCAAPRRKKSCRQKARQRTNHHGRRHRIARLGRVDHQVDRASHRRRPQASRGIVDARSQGEERKAEGRRARPAYTAGSPEIRPETAASTKPVPGGYCNTIFFDAGIGVWQGTRAAIIPFGIADFLQLVREIAVVVTDDVGVDAAQAQIAETDAPAADSRRRHRRRGIHASARSTRYCSPASPESRCRK